MREFQPFLAGSLVLLFTGYGSIEAVAAYSIGYFSENFAYTMIFYLIQSLRKERDNLRKERDKFFELSITDSLTGLFTLDHTIRLGQKMLDEENDITLLILDIDHFKQINDTYGHLVGNKALIFFSGLLKEALNGYDNVVGRLGGDEFIVLLKNLTAEQERSLLKTLYVFINSYEFYADPDIPPIKLTYVHICPFTIRSSICRRIGKGADASGKNSQGFIYRRMAA